MKECPICHKIVANTYLFKNQWLCFRCVIRERRKRDDEYYRQLQITSKEV